MEDHAAALQELAVDAQRLGQITAGVVAQVEQNAGHGCAALALALDGAQRILQFVAGVGGKLADLEIGEICLRDARPGDAVDLDLAAGHGDVHRLGFLRVQHGDRHLGVSRPADARDDLPFRQSGDVFPIHRKHDVAGQDARRLGGRAVDRCNDAELAFFLPNERADAFEGTFQRTGLLLCFVRREKYGMILVAKCGQHAVDRTVGHLGGVDQVLVDEVTVDQIPHLPKDGESRRFIGSAGRLHRHPGHGAQGEGAAERKNENCRDQQAAQRRRLFLHVWIISHNQRLQLTELTGN